MKTHPSTSHARLTAHLRAALQLSRGRLACAAAACGLALFANEGAAQTRTWTPATSDYNAAANWTPADVPDTATETALFGLAPITTPMVMSFIDIDGFTFAANAPAYVITNPVFLADISFFGAGILNNSGVLQTITNDGGNFINFFNFSTAGSNVQINNPDPLGLINFFNSANAGSAAINNSGAGPAIATSSGVAFFNTSTAAGAFINNSGANTSTFFSDSSTAGNATVLNSAPGSATLFFLDANGGTARLINADPGAFIDISSVSGAGTFAGSIEGNGRIFLGSKNFTVGGNHRSTTFSGVIRDDSFNDGITIIPAPGGSLTKVGTGVLTLTGANTYTGNTAVNGGELLIDGSIVSPQTFVNPSGLLGGGGIIGGSVLNRGIVRPATTTRGLTVNGAYTQHSDGDLRILIISNSKFGKLRVGGAAHLDGSVTPVVTTGGFKPKAGQQFRILTAGGGVHGEFDEIDQSFGLNNTILKFGLIYESNAVLLEVQQGSFGDFADFFDLTRNQKAVARGLDSIAGDQAERRLLDFLNCRTLDALPGDLDLIAPEELASIFEIGFSLANVQHTNIQRRTDDLRSGASGFSAGGLAMQGRGSGYSGPIRFRTGAAGPTGHEGKESKEEKTVYAPEDYRWGAFLTGVGEWVEVGDTTNARGYDITTGGFTVGLDYKVTPNFALGLAAGYAGTGADLTRGGRIYANSGKLGLYATCFTGGFYLDAAASGGYNSYDTKRRSLGGTARGDTEGGEFNGLLAGGYDFQIGGLKIGPTASVQYTYLGFDDFRERGSLAPLRIASQEQESFRGALGLRASYDWRVGGLIIRPEVRAAWQHEFGDTEYGIEAAFASGAGNNFTVDGSRLGRDSLLLGAGVAVQITDRTATYLYYDGQLARSEYQSHSVSGGVRVAY